MMPPRTSARPGLGDPLARALTTAQPGAPRPPGPRVNDWARAGAEAGTLDSALRGLLDALWSPGGLHRAADGGVTAIRCRPVPSAGGCYPVQTHLIVDRERWVFDHEHGVVRRRDPAADRAAGWGVETPTPATRLVFTVQPGRSFGRYRHRAWPLWIADAAYALAAAEFVLDDRADVVTYGPSAALRAMLDVPPAAHARSWTDRGLAPEIPLVAVELPEPPTLRPDAVHALARRRSPSHQQFLSCAVRRRPASRIERIARASGQEWVRGAASIRSWSVPVDTAPAELAAALWRGHLAAARLAYAAALRGLRSRAVSGIPASGDRWTFHALAFLDVPGDRP